MKTSDSGVFILFSENENAGVAHTNFYTMSVGGNIK